MKQVKIKEDWQERLFSLSRFDTSGDEVFLADERLGELIGIYSNSPFGDDLYVYDQGIYWNVNGLNYCLFFCDVLSFALADEEEPFIVIKYKSEKILRLPVRGKKGQLDDRQEFIKFFEKVAAQDG